MWGFLFKIEASASEQLEKHSEEFVKEVIKVGDNIYCAIGYGLANCIMLEGDDGVVIIDTLESREVARWAQFLESLIW